MNWRLKRVDAQDGSAQRMFSVETVTDTQDEFQEFVSVYRFSGVSNAYDQSLSVRNPGGPGHLPAVQSNVEERASAASAF